MFVTHLNLIDFRSYSNVELPLESGVTTFVGANGQGKTNLVEAIEVLATLGSHRVATDAPLIRAGAERALVRARVQAGIDDERSLVLELEINAGKANKASLNRSPLRRPRDLLGAVRVVLFSPEDLAIVKGDPSERRRFIDELSTARWPRLAGVRADYDKVLRQRSTLLKTALGRSGRSAGTDISATLDVWDAQLANFGAEIVVARLTTLAELQPRVQDAYAQIAPTKGHAGLEYKSGSVTAAASRDEVADVLIECMAQRRGEELARGQCLVGPHRDDLVLNLGELPAKGYASHGESWSFALALRLASLNLLRQDGVEPVLVLDDVFAELDQTRRTRLATMIEPAHQVLITAAVSEDVPPALRGARFAVASGTVCADPKAD